MELSLHSYLYIFFIFITTVYSNSVLCSYIGFPFVDSSVKYMDDWNEDIITVKVANFEL